MKIISALALFLLAGLGAYPCSIFRYTIDGRTYLCGNEDWTIRAAAIQTRAAAGGDYGYVLLGWKGLLPHWVQAGINSEGLCFDWAAVPPQRYVRNIAKDDVTLDFTIDVLRKCATVAEAIDYVHQHNISHLGEEHIMFADRTGESCVIEYNHERLHVVRSRSDSQFMTNFHITDASLGWYPCGRYALMEAFFKEERNKEKRLVELLDRVHQEGQYETVYSYVFDLSKMEITVFYQHNFGVGRTFSMQELLARDTVLDFSP